MLKLWRKILKQKTFLYEGKKRCDNLICLNQTKFIVINNTELYIPCVRKNNVIELD